VVVVVVQGAWIVSVTIRAKEEKREEGKEEARGRREEGGSSNHSLLVHHSPAVLQLTERSCPAAPPNEMVNE